MNTYKIRKLNSTNQKSGKEYVACSIAVPVEIAEALPEGIRFTPELTEEGILYRPVKVASTPDELPAWLSDAQGDEPEKVKPKRTRAAASA